jgi:hypothetical protein
MCTSGSIVRSGDRVAATARRPEQLDELVASHGDPVLALPFDLTDPAAVRTASPQGDGGVRALEFERSRARGIAAYSGMETWPTRPNPAQHVGGREHGARDGGSASVSPSSRSHAQAGHPAVEAGSGVDALGHVARLLGVLGRCTPRSPGARP